jgi:hypothetical protein
MHTSARWKIAMSILGLAALLGCSHGQGLSLATNSAGDDELNVRPANYRPDIVNAMHAYLNDPTGIRDAGISDPALKPVGGTNRYVVCVRFNAKKPHPDRNNGDRNDYAGVKEVAAVFLAGRFDRFVEMPHEKPNDASHGTDPARHPCADATYAAFPELERLSR